MAVTRDATGAGGTTTGAACTVSHTIVTPGANTVVLAFVAISVSSNSSSTTCTATYGGTAMTQLAAITLLGSSTNRSAYIIFYLFNPATGAQNCVATPGGASTKAGVRVSTVSYAGVATTGMGSQQSTAGLSLSTTSVTNGYNVFGHINGVTMSSPSQSQRVLLGSAVSGVGDFLLVQDAAGTGSNITFSVSGTATTPSTFGVALSPPPKIDTFTDTFGSSANWSLGGGATVSGGTLNIPMSTANAYAVAAEAYDATSSSVFAQIVYGTGGTGPTTYYKYRTYDANHEAGIIAESGNIYLYKWISPTFTGNTPIAYNSTNHAWLRLRESGGTLYLDAAPDGTTWTQIDSLAGSGLPFGAVTLIITSATSSGTGTDTVIDNVNIPGGAAANPGQFFVMF